MLAADSSSLIAYFAGENGSDVSLLTAALTNGEVCLPPVVLTELLSDLKTHNALRLTVSRWPVLEILPDYWERAGHLRASLISRGLKPKLPDTLIVQSCLDHNVSLITRDADFRTMTKHCALQLA